jgi:hypothetical protein
MLRRKQRDLEMAAAARREQLLQDMLKTKGVPSCYDRAWFCQSPIA